INSSQDIDMMIKAMIVPTAYLDFYRSALIPSKSIESKKGICKLILVTGVEIFWQVGACLPASCSSAELQNLFRPEAGASINNPICQFSKPGDRTPDIGAGFYVTLTIMGVIVVVCVISGFVDFYFTEKIKDNTISKTLAWRLFMSCSLYSNVSSIFDVSEATKGGQIGPIHCIRFFSMVWVLMSHLFSNYLGVIANPKDALSLARDLTSEAITNGFFSVDSFFFMSGVLLTFLWFKTFSRQPKEVMSPYGWAMFYVHRILRLSPAFYILIIFYTFVLNQMLRDTPLSMNTLITTDYCSETWWVEFLYVHNWVYPQEQCLAYSWYLATDMQMFLVTPLLIIPLAIKPILGLIVAAVIFILSTAANIFLVYYYHWPAGDNWFHPTDPEQTNIEDYNMLMYDSPLIRCPIYIMGMLIGWFLQSRKELKIHPIVYLACWIISLSLMLTVLLGLHDQTNGTDIGIFWRAMYSSLSRPAWGIGLSAIVILCYYGYGGPINAFMSWHIWVPLGRLSYSSYLIHIPIIQLVLSQTKDEVYFSNFIEFFITRLVSITAVTFFFAVFWSSCFELSFGRIEKLLLGGMRAPKHSIEKIETEKKEEKRWE
ncbi:hypothetical protein PENTCL1PPCAC_12932, partial [Pristionchus entomophagus]